LKSNKKIKAIECSQTREWRCSSPFWKISFLNVRFKPIFLWELLLVISSRAIRNGIAVSWNSHA